MDRKLTTIFASDVVGFSKMMGMDEVNTLKILKERREAIETFKTIKILNWHLFYLAAIYAKKGDKELAKEKLKEAKAVSGTDINQFIDSQPYTKEELPTSLKDVLNSIRT